MVKVKNFFPILARDNCHIMSVHALIALVFGRLFPISHLVRLEKHLYSPFKRCCICMRDAYVKLEAELHPLKQTRAGRCKSEEKGQAGNLIVFSGRLLLMLCLITHFNGMASQNLSQVRL